MTSPIAQIISGGQTGADRAALDWAIRSRITHGGWCPSGRRAEDGPIPARYELQETPTDDYATRTEWNVRDSDGTAILSLSETLTGGSALTQLFAASYGKPCLHLHTGLGVCVAASRLQALVRQHFITRLNIAGPRESEEPAVAQFVTDVLNAAWGVP